MIVSIFIKYFYFKERPLKKEKTNLIERLDAASFPSTHSMRIFSLMFWIVLLGDMKLTIYSTIIVFLVSYSRIYLKKHYLIDVIFGIILSFIINILIWWII